MKDVVSNERIDELADEIALAATYIDAATHTLLTHIRDFDELDGWHRQGALSFAHWLSWRVGLDLGAAREKVRVARKLGELPLIDEALRKGKVSFSKVRAMTRVATPESEEQLLDMALCVPAAQLEKICRLYRGIQPKTRAQRREDEDRRWVRSRQTDDGMVRIDAQLLPQEAAVVLAAIDATATKKSRPDGLVDLAEAAVRGDKPQRSPTELIVHVDSATLQGHTEDGTGVSAETVKRLCCDAGLVPILEDADGKPLDVGRKTRTIPAAIHRAVVLRDDGCRFPGCSNRIIDVHHLVHWIDHGITSMDNCLSLCRRHHRCVHELGFSITPQAGDELTFRDADGAVIVAQADRPKLARDALEHLRQTTQSGGIPIHAQTSLPNWHGDVPDYAACVQALSSCT